MTLIAKKDTPVRVLIVGAGNINFGSDEGPWNHSQRIERKLGARLQVIGLVDPAVERAKGVLAAKASTLAAGAYAETIIYASLDEAIAALADSPPDMTLVGTPPAFRGSMNTGLNIEQQLVEAFPSCGLFIEKPVGAGDAQQANAVGKYLETRDNVISVGYMLRYSAAAQMIKQILRDENLTVMMTSARYIMAYTAARKAAWWNKAIDQGPIVEQATHFVDLSRYFAGEVNLASVKAHAVEWNEKPGQLSQIQIDESAIPEQDRIPRFTSATWKYENGAIGHLEHGVALQGQTFFTEIVVYADGYQMRLCDPYNRPTLFIRRPGSDSEEVHEFHHDDPFYNEMSAFIDRSLGEAEPEILSSFADAARTYEATWAIRLASEADRAK